MSTFPILFRTNLFLPSTPRGFTPREFQIGGYGSTRGFHAFGFERNDFKIFIEKSLPAADFYQLTFSQKVVRMTGKPFPTWLQTWRKSIDKYSPVAIDAAEIGVKHLTGMSSVPVAAAGTLSAGQQRHSDINLLRAILWGQDQLKTPETIHSRWFSLANAAIIRPAIIDALISYCMGGIPPFVVAKGGGIVLNLLFDWMRKKTEDFFDPPTGDAPPPPPPPHNFSKESETDSNEKKKGNGGGGDDSRFGDASGPGLTSGVGKIAYKQLPPHLVEICQGLCVLGMTWRGATSLLSGEPVTGRDADVVRWISGLAKIQCQDCNLSWFVPESMLSLFTLHFSFKEVNIAWCRHCEGMTPVRISRIDGIWIS